MLWKRKGTVLYVILEEYTFMFALFLVLPTSSDQKLKGEKAKKQGYCYELCFKDSRRDVTFKMLLFIVFMRPTT